MALGGCYRRVSLLDRLFGGSFIIILKYASLFLPPLPPSTATNPARMGKGKPVGRANPFEVDEGGKLVIVGEEVGGEGTVPMEGEEPMEVATKVRENCDLPSNQNP